MEEAWEYGLTRGTCFVARRLEVVAVAGLLWISWCVLGAAGFRVSHEFAFSNSQSQSSQRRLGEGSTAVNPPAHRELAPTDPQQVFHLSCSHLRIMESVVVIAHSPSHSDLRPHESNFNDFSSSESTHRAAQSPLFARQSTPVDMRKRDVEACVVAPSIPAGRCVAALCVTRSPCRTYRLWCSWQLAGPSGVSRVKKMHF